MCVCRFPHGIVNCLLIDVSHNILGTSCFAMTKHYNQGNLQKEEFILAYTSRMIKFIMIGEIWQQVQ